VYSDPDGKEKWHLPIHFHIGNLAIAATGDKVGLQGKEGLAYISVSSNAVHIMDPAADDSHSTSHRIAWSPSEDHIVYERDGKILILDLASRQSQQLAAGFDPSWSPDGRLDCISVARGLWSYDVSLRERKQDGSARQEAFRGIALVSGF
jgi:hypothetical protein